MAKFRVSVPVWRTRLGSAGRGAALVAALAGIAAPGPIAAAAGSSTNPPLIQASAPAGPATLGDSEIKARVDGAALAVGGEALQPALLRRFYQAHDYEPMWTAHQPQAAALWHAVLQAGAQGLDPDRFHAAALAKSGLSATDRELLMSDAFLTYIGALSRGMVPSEARPHDQELSPEPIDAVAALDAAIASPDPAAAVEALAPASAQYAALRRGYQTYQAIANAGGWPRVPDGQTADRVSLLQQRLAAENYLPAGYSTNQLDDTTIQALRSFQERHGLEPDGKLGAATLAELNVDAEARVRQIAVNLERQRWLPRPLPADRVWVNTASAVLELYRADAPVFTTRVVVGEVDKQTPEFQAAIVSVLYNPPWNIPYGIAQREIMPLAEADPSYLERHHMSVRANGSIQQQAGPYSALGRLKFEMPNRFDVYLHDTPLRNLFARENRRLSHGCVRVQNPRELASLVMGIPENEITRAINTGATNRRNLPQSLPVFVVYQTAFVDDSGALQFRRDVYQRDNDVWQRLTRTPQTPLAQRPLNQRRG